MAKSGLKRKEKASMERTRDDERSSSRAPKNSLKVASAGVEKAPSKKTRKEKKQKNKREKKRKKGKKLDRTYEADTTEAEPGEIQEDVCARLAKRLSYSTSSSDEQSNRAKLEARLNRFGPSYVGTEDEDVEEFLIVSDDEDVSEDDEWKKDMLQSVQKKARSAQLVLDSGTVRFPKNDIEVEDTIAAETVPGEHQKLFKQLLTSQVRARERESRTAIDFEGAEFLALNGSDELSEKDDEQRKTTPSQENIELGPDSLPYWLQDEHTAKKVLGSGDRHEALHHEILALYEFLQPRYNEWLARDAVIDRVKEHVGSVFPNAMVYPYGSFATNLYLPESDVDLCVVNLPKKVAIKSALTRLGSLFRADAEHIRRCDLLLGARVPIVKLLFRGRDGLPDIPCDISFGSTQALQNVFRILYFLDRYPPLQPLLFVLKCYMRQRKFHEVYTGGLSSYALVLMAVSHIQRFTDNFPRWSKPNLGLLLHTFFDFFGHMFNYAFVGISVLGPNGQYFDKTESVSVSARDIFRLCIEDPDDIHNILGTSSFLLPRIRTQLKTESRNIHRWEPGGAGIWNQPTPLLEILDMRDPILVRRARMLRRMASAGDSEPTFDAADGEQLTFFEFMNRLTKEKLLEPKLDELRVRNNVPTSAERQARLDLKSANAVQSKRQHFRRGGGARRGRRRGR
ncbi:Non-canonical poly(A) RNA polymerase protein Trf4-1 [Porphyridium purpureum]|uniref:Non-canonical poly(A) RNA polymerase protein Trf4-1 n=1 Tax=Porphyridium purpureum TaxID=35688 RepID=A0A5J4YK13_PORPP|nr:Non-canonical poly(A) RNA polymerase protein Trf4-1 [Porphyridium purpureum]|eukprot:POR9869..scf297_16